MKYSFYFLLLFVFSCEQSSDDLDNSPKHFMTEADADYFLHQAMGEMHEKEWYGATITLQYIINNCHHEEQLNKANRLLKQSNDSLEVQK